MIIFNKISYRHKCENVDMNMIVKIGILKPRRGDKNLGAGARPERDHIILTGKVCHRFT